ncbi:MAG: hypothetical protein ISS45_08610 [Candidatus Omnitrophica bacterium]|nr:hypothetical protein [Candidatus Omnitrophota bacterium]
MNQEQSLMQKKNKISVMSIIFLVLIIPLLWKIIAVLLAADEFRGIYEVLDEKKIPFITKVLISSPWGYVLNISTIIVILFLIIKKGIRTGTAKFYGVLFLILAVYCAVYMLVLFLPVILTVR